MKNQRITFDTCRSCGRPLADPEQELCPSCRSLEAAKARYLQTQHISRARRRRVNPVTRRMLIAVCVLAVVFVGLCAAATVLYSRYSPEQFLAGLDGALQRGDARALSRMLRGEDLTVSEEGAAALCRAFADADRRQALLRQMAAQAVDADAEGDFPALKLRKEPVFLGYGSYHIRVHSVQLLLHSTAQNLILSLDGVPRAGEQLSEGILYRDLFPGQYSCTVTGITALSQPLQGEPTELLLFSDGAPSVFDGALPCAALTVHGCINDTVSITVDGMACSASIQDGAAVLPPVALGSVIGMQYTAPWGAVTTAQVQFTDLAVTELTFGEPVTEGGVPTPEELTSLLTICGATWLDALNQQDLSLLSGCTDAYRDSLAGELATDFHKENLFVFGSVECMPAVKSTPGEASPTISCCAKLNYSYTNRESAEETAGTRYAVCSFVWQDGWKLAARTDVSEETYLATTLDTLP